ncbi:MAG: isoleucine--tRNA ligase [Dehalococcoidales bacterium]|nr:isoleucine--tRNA ligase [Dehalococcoidales bacterium]
MFHAVASRVSFPEIEQSILTWWQQNHIFERSIDKRRQERRFVFYEGPPTANGSPGIHHVLARVFKDVIPRYKTMKGYYAPRIAGWDTHGLPVELEVEKKLSFSSKAQIEEYGIARFNALCRNSVLGYLREWNTMTERIGFWVDLKHPYITMDNNYIETVWWAIKQMWDKGLVYQGYRVTPHCPRCGTSLSSHEVAQGYQDDTKDPSVYIKFKVAKPLYEKPGFLGQLRDSYGNRTADIAEWLIDLVGSKPVYLLAWTTTPWTLPGNTALAVSADAEYSIVELNNEYLILSSARMGQVGLDNMSAIAKVKGIDLVDLRYEPLFNPHDYGIAVQTMTQLDKKGRPSADIIWKQGGYLNYPVITTGFVTMEDGTGVVHIAPAYGEADYQAGLDNALDFVHPVNLEGKITGSYPFSGRFVKEADPLIMDNLKTRELLFRSETIHHTYPFCWRCEAPLLYYAKQTWYIRTTAVKEELIKGNQEINWYPEHIKYGRFGDWLKNNIDWAFSRERYWGTPLPVWRCESCGSFECIGGINELKNKPGASGFEEPLDMHRPFVDEITFRCCQCGAQMKREPEVVDCWFDSGAMPIAQWHYPFENETLLKDGRFPADYICEAVDQTRGWFYSLHAISTLLFGQPSFRNVICLGHILDDNGEKMSKARGNVVEPMAMIDKYGADALRWYCLTASPPGNVRRFSEKLVSEISRRFLLTLWNVYSFFVTYANIDHFTPGTTGTSEPSGIDKWVISELNQLVIDVDQALEAYNPTEAGRKIEEFVDGLSNWYVRRSRRRFWKSEDDADKLSAYCTLYQCLTILSKLLAPFTPFLAEEIYRNLVGTIFPEAPSSVHLADFPSADTTLIDTQLSSNTRLAMKISSLGRAARSKAGIKVRQPLATNYVILNSISERLALESVKPEVLEELNIKELKVIDNMTGLEEKGYVISSEGEYSIAVPTEISAELLAEGMAREIVHRLQTMRRSTGLDITDHITTYYQGGAYVRQVLSDFAGYVKQETLSQELVEGTPPKGAFTESYRLGGHDMVLGVRRLD